MSDVVVTVPKSFTHPNAPGKRGLAAWLAEGDSPGEPWSGQEWWFTTYGFVPKIEPGERVYVVCDGRLVGYAPLVSVRVDADIQDAAVRAAKILGRDTINYHGPIAFVRGGGAVACTIDEKITGFRGWRYRFWNREDEKPISLENYG